MDENRTEGAALSDGDRALQEMIALVRRRPSMQDKMHLIAETETSKPEVVRSADRRVQESPEHAIMSDDTLRLLAIRHHHRNRRLGERDYYIHSFPQATQRSAIRDALRVGPPSHVDEVVLFVTVDCMRGGQLSCNGYAKPTTPAIDELAEQGVNFPAAFSTAGQTAQSFPGLMLSNYFQNFGRGRIVPEHLTTLAEVFSRAGYHNVAFNAANPHISHFYGYDRGFDEFCDFLGPENFDYTDDTFRDDSSRRTAAPSERELMAIFEDCQARPDVYQTLRELTGLEGLPLVRQIATRARFYPYDAADLVKATLGSIADRCAGAKRFYWLHLMDLHENITVPFSRLGSFSTAQQFLLNTLLGSPLGVEVLNAYAGKYRELYDSAVSYVDMNVEVLANYLKDSGLLDVSLLCLTGDHGQELMEHGVFGHGYDRLVESLVRVPLVFSGGKASGLRSADTNRPVSTLDIAPTVLDLCDIEPVPETFLGTTLRDDSPRPLYGQTFYDGADNRCSDCPGRAFELKPFPAPVRECCNEIVYCIQDGHQFIYDRAKDSSEIHRLVAQPGMHGARPDAEELRRQTVDYFETVYSPPQADYAFELSAEDKGVVEMRLQDLGYL